jgi:hypothetical protein
MIKITVNHAVLIALRQAFPKPANSAERALHKYVKTLEDMLFASLQRQATPMQRKLELFSISLQKLANEGGQIGPRKQRLHAWLREHGFNLVEPVVKGSNLVGTVSECKLTQWVTMVDTMAIEEAILINSTSNRDIDAHLGGDEHSNIELMHLLYPEFKRYKNNLAALEQFELVEVDVESLKSYIYWLVTDAIHISREQKDMALRQARIVLGIANVLSHHYPQRKKPSAFGRMYYEGTSIQNVNKELRRAILGNCWEYDIRSSVIAWKMGWAKEYMQTRAPDKELRKVFQATISYLEDKSDFMATVKHFTFDAESPVPKDLQTKLLKTAFTAISFGARVSSTGWKSDSGEWTNPAIVDILKNADDRRRFLADPTVKAFIAEQTLLDDYLYDKVKQERAELLKQPFLQTASGRPSKSKILAYLYQHDETEIMNVVRALAKKYGREPLANIHDAIVFRKRLGVDIKTEMEFAMQDHSGNPYWHLTAKELKRYTPRLLDVEVEEAAHRARMLAEEQFAEQYGAEIRQAMERWGFSLSSYSEAPKA